MTKIIVPKGSAGAIAQQIGIILIPYAGITRIRWLKGAAWAPASFNGYNLSLFISRLGRFGFLSRKAPLEL